MDSHKHPHGPAQQVRPHMPDEWISDSGWALLWINAILLIPAMFGVLFLLI
jgi:hypothetical protein